MASTRKEVREKKARIQSRLMGVRAIEGPRGYGLPLLAVVLLWIVATLLNNSVDGLSHAPLAEGQRAPLTYIAQVDFDAPDLAATELARRQQADQVVPVFTISTTGLQSMLRSLDHYMDRILQVRDEAHTGADSGFARIHTIPVGTGELSLRMDEVVALLPSGHENTVRGAFRTAISEVWERGILSLSEKNSLFHGVASGGRISLAMPEQSPRPPMELAHLYTPDQAARAAVKRAQAELGEQTIPEYLLHNVLRILVQPNLSYNAERTNAARLQALGTVSTIMRPVRAGATLINQGDRITTQQIEEWRAHERRLNELRSPMDRRLQRLARSFLLLFALVICSGLLQIVRPDVVQSPSRILMLVLLCILSLLAIAGLLYLSNTTQWMRASMVEHLLPLAFAPLLATILIGPATAVVVGAWMAYASAVMFENSFSIFAMGLLVTIIVAHVARDTRKRSRMVRVGLWIGFAQMLYSLSLAFLLQYPLNTILIQCAVAMLNGVITALFALAFLPLFESMFDITTDITLLELSDMGHPLLQRMAIEAPGTYHHSLMVANLAQAATAEIGGNALLVRVCAYFHDIGKLTKPDFFSENMQFRENPHDDLAPSMSTLVIISHVKEGVAMARRAKLPQMIVDAIEQHHGTGLVAYFYHRAKTQREVQASSSGHAAGGTDARAVSDQDYRYPGPRPRIPEMGILLLADSVEAASRSMEKPTPGRIESLVNDIVDSRLLDEQLDDCDLTFAQLKAIKRSFVFTLTNMLHGRVPYPKDEDRNPASPNRAEDSPKPAH